MIFDEWANKINILSESYVRQHGSELGTDLKWGGDYGDALLSSTTGEPFTGLAWSEGYGCSNGEIFPIVSEYYYLRDGFKQDLWVSFYENTVPERKRFLAATSYGASQGPYIVYYENGNLKEESFLIFGSPMWTIHYDINGKIIPGPIMKDTHPCLDNKGLKLTKLYDHYMEKIKEMGLQVSI